MIHRLLPQCLLTLILLPLTLGCISVPDPKPDDWLAVGFRTPEQTFRTYQTAFAGDRPSLEYRCLSSGFKSRIDPNFTELAYREFREALLKEQPATKYLSCGKLIERNELEDGRVQLVVKVKKYWVERQFEVLLVRESFLRMQSGESVLVAEDLDNLGEWFTRNDEVHPGYWQTFVPMTEGISPDEFSEVLMATDWKIDELRQLSAP